MMATPTSRPRVQPPVPPLEAGDHLTRAEFERRYKAMPELKKAELIEGVVKEYLVWRVRDQAIDWFVLRQGQYRPLPLADGLYRSEVFPGLWLDPAALTRFDLATVLQVLQRGAASAEHAAFVTRLQQAGGKP
jgi:hypothetical protein